MSKYLEFNLEGWTEKTFTWTVRSRSPGLVVGQVRWFGVLGQIKWFGRWRQYCFWPSPDTAFSPGCMNEISNFIKDKMARRKNDRSKLRKII